MIKIVSKFLVPRGFAGISIGPVIIARRRDMLNNPIFLTHEYIHFFQQLELLFIGFWVLYPLLYLIGRLRGKSNDGAYRDNPFEREAYPQVVYYKLQGYDKTYPDCCDGFPLFPDFYFVDLISDEALAEEISETHFITLAPV